MIIINENIIRNMVTESLKNLLSEKTLLKINKPKSEIGGPSAPVDNTNPTVGGEPNMMGNTTAMGEDPSTMNVDPTINGDPNATDNGGDMGEDPNVTNDGTNMGEDPNAMDGESDGDSDSTMDIINQLSDEDREAVRSYAESMLNKNSNTDKEEPMMESFIFTKAQIKMLNENFGPTEDELQSKDNDNRRQLEKKNATKKVSKKSPFNAPNFN